MNYTVQARLIPASAAELLHKLRDGIIENQQPDGKEIVASMKRAVIDDDGIVRWSEVCYCPTPLQHERATVYDHHFTDFKTEQAEDYVEFEGAPLLTRLEAITPGNDAQGN